MKCKISCPVHKEDFREFEITPEGRVWPCCYYANAWEKRLDPFNEEAETMLKDGIWEEVLRIEVVRQDENEKVYNFTVKDINSYIANGIVVHNK